MRQETRLHATLAVALVVASGGIAAAGPDVIVGELPASLNFGLVGTKRAMSVATTSCNVGNTPLTWIANNNQHPVISQNIYRLHQGRFAQVGQAWLKHGFCALQGTVCSPCTPGGSCPALYPGCSDPYDAGLNGQQSGLGPKSEVNAFTGAFPYPWINNGSGSGAVFKRLQADTTVLGTPGALYFVSSMYVQPEDAAGGLALNNESYRACTTTTAGITALTGITHREKAGLQAWKDSDATVQIVNFDVPGEGRFIVAMKATSLGGGQWHYEYAAQNFNSDRSGQALQIPIPAGTAITNIGFSDVDYHSGEPYALTDWTSNVTSTQVSWATQTFAQNSNANALRWDTIYNFWFDANVAPGAGSLTINLFKAGTPASVSGNIQVPGGAGGPANDACGNATTLSAYGSSAFNTAGATTDGPTETLCNGSGSAQVYNDIWYTYTACVTGSHTLSTCGANFDTRIAVYPAACPGATLNTAIACNDDSALCGTNSLQSSVSFNATSGTTYRIRLGAFTNNTTVGGGVGSGNLVLAGPTCGPADANGNLCANAVVISGYGAFPVTTTGASTDGPAEAGICNFFNHPQLDNDVWRRWTSCVAGAVTFSTCNAANFDTELALYGGTCPSATGSVLACNDDAAGCAANSSSMTFTVAANTTYLIRVGGWNGASGTATLTLSGPACPPPGPANNDCANRSGVGIGNTAYTTVGATTDGPAHVACDQSGSNQVTNDVWFNHPSSCPGSVRIALCDANFDSKLAVYDDAGCTNFDARILACNDDTVGCGATNLGGQVRIASSIGRNYTIRVGGFNGATGSGNMTITYCPADFDTDGTVAVPDIFAFLSAWFAMSPRSDLDGVGGVGVPDIFAFLSLWFAGAGACG